MKVAACLSEQAARKTESHCKAYRKDAPLSSLKMQIGELLLCLQALSENERQEQWPVFESEFKQYADLRFCEVNL